MKWHARAVRVTLYSASVALFAIFAHVTRRAEEYGSVVRYVAYGFVSFLATKWLVIGVANLLLGLSWVFVVALPPHRLPGARSLITLVNRQIGHIEALFALTIAAVVSMNHLTGQAAVVLFALLLGGAVADGLVLATGAAPNNTSIARRPIFYLLTAFGLLWLYRVDRGQWLAVAPLAYAILLGSALRLVTWIVWARSRRHDLNQHTPIVDHLALLIAVGTAALIPARLLHATAGQHARDRHERSRYQQPLTAADAPRPDVAVFLVADNQFHELERERMGVQLDLVSSYERVVARPVELDLLSGATLLHFADVFRALQKTRASLRWAHLGDMADIGCPSELRRFSRLIEHGWPLDRLVAIAPGNHDVLFFGNFLWHPGWTHACGSDAGSQVQRLELAAAIDHLATRAQRPASPLGEGGALPQVALLGQTEGRPVVGVFIDTSDFGGYALGAAGVQGEVSTEQLDWLTSALQRYDNHALVIMLMHHPPDELSALSQRRLRQFAARLGRRLIAVVSAHTHFAALRQWQLEGRAVPDLVIGSTTDPPQEAALLELGPAANGRLTLQVRTLQAVSRQALSFDEDVGSERVTDSDCQAFVRHWHDECPQLRRPLAPDLACIVQGHPRTPTCLRQLQEARATELRACVCRGDRCAAGGDAFGVSRYDELALRSETARKEMVCLSWAASLALGKESDGWRWRRFVSDDAFGADATPAALTASIETDPLLQ